MARIRFIRAICAIFCGAENHSRHIMGYMAENEEIIHLLKNAPEGLTAQAILMELGASAPAKRTLQRHLASLIKKGKIHSQGHGKNILYFAIKIDKPGLLDLIKKPFKERPSATYSRQWLDDYKPNHIFYLPFSVREELMKLGTVETKIHLAGTFAKEIYSQFLIDLTWNSSRLEGNTYSLLETKHLLEQEIVPKEKSMVDTQMILNHKEAIIFLIESAEHVGIDKFTLLNLHALLSNNLLPNPSSCGKLRSIPVAIAGSSYKPLDIPLLIEECFDLLVKKANAILDPFEQAFFLMVHLPYLQPFEDVNKRVSRLAANIPFIRHNLCPLTFALVSDDLYMNALIAIYELNNLELLIDLFVFAYTHSSSLYKKSRAVLGKPDPFRFHHREAISQIVQFIVEHNIKAQDAPKMIRDYAKAHLPLEEREFINVIEQELLSLHEGNLARYKISLEAFKKWKKVC